MQGKRYYTYMHLLDERLIYIGIGTKHPEYKTEGMIYPRAFNLASRKKNYKRAIKGRRDDVVIVIVEEFNTREEAIKHEEELHQLHRDKFNFFKDINYSYKLYSQPQSKVMEKKNKPIRCITTNEIFNSLNEASRKYKVDVGNLSNHMKGKYISCGKHPATKEPLKFEYIK